MNQEWYNWRMHDVKYTFGACLSPGQDVLLNRVLTCILMSDDDHAVIVGHSYWGAVHFSVCHRAHGQSLNVHFKPHCWPFIWEAVHFNVCPGSGTITKRAFEAWRCSHCWPFIWGAVHLNRVQCTAVHWDSTLKTTLFAGSQSRCTGLQ